MRRLLRTAAWDADAVRDDVRGFVVARLGDAAGVLICDETGLDIRHRFGGGAAPIQRHRWADRELPGRRVPQLRLGAGPALIDRRVYLPKSWTGDRPRCTAAGIPADRQFATKPELALEMITSAVAARTPAAWVASDEAYGDNGAFRPGSPAEYKSQRLGSHAA
jgi:SRSO17 transposase